MFPDPVEPELPYITGSQLFEVAKKLAQSAPGLDGWKVRELKALPIEFWDLAAAILDSVEHGAD